jgi:hypothetical protein
VSGCEVFAQQVDRSVAISLTAVSEDRPARIARVARARDVLLPSHRHRAVRNARCLDLDSAGVVSKEEVPRCACFLFSRARS